jgi:alpha-tubulin suppressor-like RCC1 family protein
MPINYKHACILDGGGYHYFTCGTNGSGQLGNGDNRHSEVFIQVNLPIKFISLSAGYEDHTLGLAIDGSLWSWGSNAYGQLGQGKRVPFLTKPTRIRKTRAFTQISAGHRFSLALDENGCVWSFGMSHQGRLGLGQTAIKNNEFTPKQIKTLPNIKSIAAGCQYGIVLDDSGNVWSFGANYHGQLGQGDESDKWEPIKIQALQDVVQISAGFCHNLILDSLGCVWSFGYNGNRQLGHSSTNSNIPVIIPNMQDIIQVFAAGNSSIVLDNLYHVFVFGWNEHKELELSNKANIAIPIEQVEWRNKTLFPGGNHTLLLDEYGQLIFYGAVSGISMQSGIQLDIVVHKKSMMKRAVG